MARRRQRRPIARATWAAFGVAVLLAACGGGGNQGGEGTAETLTLQHSMLPEPAQELLGEFAAQYEDETGVSIEISYVPWENQRSTTLSKIASGQAPDILHGNSNQGSSEFVTMGALADLEPLLSDELKQDLIDTAFDELGTTGIPFVQSPETAIFYRPSMFKDANVTPPPVDQPWTWEEFLAAARALTKDTDGTIDQWGFAERGLAGFIAMKSYIPHLWAFGSDLIVPDGDDWKSGLETPEARQAIEEQIALSTTERVMPDNYLSWGLPEAMRAWGDDKVAMMNVGMWWASSVNSEFGHEFGTDFDVMMFPVSDDSNAFSFTTYDYWHITETSPNREEAYEFIEWMVADPKHAADMAAANFNLPPTTKSALEDPRFSGESFPLWSERFAQWQEYSRFMPASPDYTALWTSTVIPIWEEIVTGKTSLDDGLTTMHQEIASELG